MGSATDRLLGLAEATHRFDIPLAEIRSTQMEAVNEQFSERIGTIKLLANRAEAAGIKRIRDVADLVPLLFAHTAYKSYPENWFTEGKWDRMGRWLDTITTRRVIGVDLKDVNDVDDWIERVAATGHYLSCSSGTTGKCSMLPADADDRAFTKRTMPTSFTWGTGIKPERQYKIFSLAPVARTFRANDARDSLRDAFGATYRPLTSGEPVTVGRVNKMVVLRRSIADGTARPADIAAFEKTNARRAKEMQDALQGTAEAIVASRGERIMLQGLPAALFQVTELVRGMGYRGQDFQAENVLSMSGGPKGAKLPGDFREQILQTFNIGPQRNYHMYSMQDINSVMPACKVGRYHVPPWLILVLLDETGEQLITPVDGAAEGRAAFLDLALSGRWGGVITGDKVHVDYRKCACGHEGPTVGGDIVRYADGPGGDKITCSGTIDAYIRGVA